MLRIRLLERGQKCSEVLDPTSPAVEPLAVNYVRHPLHAENNIEYVVPLEDWIGEYRRIPERAPIDEDFVSLSSSSSSQSTLRKRAKSVTVGVNKGLPPTPEILAPDDEVSTPASKNNNEVVVDDIGSPPPHSVRPVDRRGISSASCWSATDSGSALRYNCGCVLWCEACCVEVKGPNDRLAAKQIMWLQLLHNAGVLSFVGYVKEEDSVAV
jgi:hypothetical protein